MKYINNIFSIEKVSAVKLAKKFKTPIYCYSYNKIKKNILAFKKNFKSLSPLICFAVKSNSNLQLLKEIKKHGCGADVVSLGELMKAIKAGISPQKIVFSGIGKTYNELAYAINKKILLINAESKSEIFEIEKIAKSKNKIVDIGIRLNPDIDAKTISQISTGKKINKFGIEEKIFYELVNYSKKSKYLNLKCLSVHIGSQILNHQPYVKMLKILSKIIIKSKYKFEFIDLGGGMGISYENKKKKLNYKIYNKEINKFLKKHKKIVIKPTHGYGGKNILFVDQKLKKKKILNYIAKHDQVMVQKFLPKIKEGDKRIFLIGGHIKGAIRRIPARGSIISNIGQGGTPTKTILTKQELKIAKIVAANLKKNKIFFAGIDLISGYLTGDINITSPTGLKNYKDLTGINLAVDFWNYLEN